MTEDEFVEHLESLLQKAQSLSSDAGSITHRSISEVVQAYRFKRSLESAAADHSHFGVRVRQIVNGGSG